MHHHSQNHLHNEKQLANSSCTKLILNFHLNRTYSGTQYPMAVGQQIKNDTR